MLRPQAAVALLFLALPLTAQGGAAPPDAANVEPLDAGEKSLSADDLLRDVKFLAADEMKGRLAGTAEARRAAEYIEKRMEKLGLRPAGEPRSQYLQKFKFPGKTGRNVCGVVPGTHPSLRKQFVVIGAHFDHAGMGRFGRIRSRRGEVHNGADDNGSGTVGLLELAEAFSQNPTRRSLLFLAFSAEEWGLFGSKAWARKPTVPLHSVVAMINMDMIGRSSERYLFVGGVHTGRGFLELLREVNEPFAFDLEVCGGGPGPSDMNSFYEKGVPVLFFTTGLHPQYHTPDDDVELLNLTAERDLLRVVYRVARHLADDSKRPVFQEDDRQGMPAGEKGDNRGSDHIYAMLGARARACRDVQGGGVELQQIAGKSPARRAGIRDGDVVLAIDDQPVADRLALTRRLAAAAYGSRIAVKLRRGHKVGTIKVKLERW